MVKLTKSQQAVWDLVQRGLSRTQIALELNMSRASVSVHLHLARKALGARAPMNTVIPLQPKDTRRCPRCKLRGHRPGDPACLPSVYQVAASQPQVG